MESASVISLFLVLISALIGGYLAKLTKLQPIIGYIFSGLIVSTILPVRGMGIEKLAEIGTVFLLFSIGLEFSLNKFNGIFKKVLIVSASQIILVIVFMMLLLRWLGLETGPALVLSMGFSLSSTAVVLKILSEKNELFAIHGKIMLGWLLVQDLAVVPIMVTLPFIGSTDPNLLSLLFVAFTKAILLIVSAVVLGKHIVPFFIHKITQTNSRELLLLTSVCLALGTAYGVTLLGVSATLGAFLAGLVVSESQENHAVFAETRPLRDLFVAIFFVSLGLLVDVSSLVNNLPAILILSMLIITLKALMIMALSILTGFKGKTSVMLSLGLSQVGEFAFVLFATASSLGILSSFISSLAVSASLVTLIITPILFKYVVPLWRSLKVFKIMSPGLVRNNKVEEIENHIIICGYGRVGSWVGKALTTHKIPLAVIEYDQSIVNELIRKEIPVVYGDPTEYEVLEVANISKAKAIVIAIPDRFTQESIITYLKKNYPQVKIISRVNRDEDWEKLKSLSIDKLVQPEFEAAEEIIKNILKSLGRSKEQISHSLKNLRVSHAKT